MIALLATHGYPAFLRDTLQSLVVSARFAAGVLERIIVVENGGDFGAGAICEEVNADGLIEVISESEANKSKALNVGLSHCDDGLILMLDDDVTIDPDLIVAYQRVAGHHGRGHFFGGPVRTVCEGAPESWLEPFLPPSVGGFPASSKTPDDFLGANWAAYKSDLLVVGGFNPNFGPGSLSGATGQETEMQQRLVRAGVQPVWIPEAFVTHFVPSDRCTPEWIVQRGFRRAVAQGILRALEDPDAATRLIHSRLKRQKLRGVAATVLPGTKRRFRHQYWCQWNAGFARGIELVMKNQLVVTPFEM